VANYCLPPVIRGKKDIEDFCDNLKQKTRLHHQHKNWERNHRDCNAKIEYLMWYIKENFHCTIKCRTYTLTSESLGRDLIPEKYLIQLPRNYHAPVILLGCLARDLKAKGTGLGEYLLMDALFRSYKLSKESIGAMAVVTDPINEKAFEFYQKYGFYQLPDSQKMFLPRKTIGQLL
jgi:GNAT superfamily N-acetyltransferase